MSRGLKGFLVFLTGLVLLAGSVAVYLGPNVLVFIFHKDRKSAPVVMLNLVRFYNEQSERKYLSGFQKPLQELCQAYGAKTLLVARTDRVVQGNSRDEWQRLEFVSWPSRAAFMEMVTSGAYGDLSHIRESTTAERAWIAATATTGIDLETDKAYVLRLQWFDGKAARTEYFSDWQDQEAQSLTTAVAKSAAVFLAADLNTLEAPRDQQWQFLKLYGFPDRTQRQFWLDDETRATLWSLERHLFERDVLLSLDSVH